MRAEAVAQEIRVRLAAAEDLPQVEALYEAWKYTGRVAPGDTIVVADRKGEMVGVLRLVPEQGTTVLRGMRVQPTFQGQGVGSRMLELADRLIGPRECYCLAYAHLREFYGRIGFKACAEGPAFLNARIAGYRNRRDGEEYVMLRRENSAVSSRGPGQRT